MTICFHTKYDYVFMRQLFMNGGNSALVKVAGWGDIPKNIGKVLAYDGTSIFIRTAGEKRLGHFGKFQNGHG